MIYLYFELNKKHRTEFYLHEPRSTPRVPLVYPVLLRSTPRELYLIYLNSSKKTIHL